MNAPASSLPLALTMGDPAGIGPEIILKAFALHPEQMRGVCVVGDLAAMQQHLQSLSAVLPVQLQCVAVPNLSQVWRMGNFQVPVLQAGASLPFKPGQASAEGGLMAADAITGAASAALRGEVAAVVTAPLHKKALSLAGIEHPGHTEMLQALAAAHLGLSVTDLPVRMMLRSPGLSTVLVSIHVALRQAIEAVTTANVLQTLRITHTAWLQLHGRAPRMVVAGLNPHAGEDGLFGTEELTEIAPAIAQAQQLGLQVSGPYPPDTVFMNAHSAAGQASTDVVVAMYHDQGLIPVKYLGLENGVNQTLGLPFVRTSPDHGTAFDIVGQGVADPSSLLAAVRVARGQAV
jgi:4-hydroxythreonine-4-phosphate dehydrogenase